jgi:hypothetical protein
MFVISELTKALDFCQNYLCDFHPRIPGNPAKKALHWSPIAPLKVVTNEKIGGSGVTTTLGTWYGGVVMGVLFSCNEAAILYRDFNSAPSLKQNIIVFAAYNGRCCECHVAPTIIL